MGFLAETECKQRSQRDRGWTAWAPVTASFGSWSCCPFARESNFPTTQDRLLGTGYASGSMSMWPIVEQIETQIHSSNTYKLQRWTSSMHWRLDQTIYTCRARISSWNKVQVNKNSTLGQCSFADVSKRPQTQGQVWNGDLELRACRSTVWRMCSSFTLKRSAHTYAGARFPRTVVCHRAHTPKMDTPRAATTKTPQAHCWLIHSPNTCPFLSPLTLWP